jgi:hypothetical protein
MASSKLLKEAIADAKAVRETAIANAKIALEEAFAPKIQSLISEKISNEFINEAIEGSNTKGSSGIGKKNGKPSKGASSAHTDLSGIKKQSAKLGTELDDYSVIRESEDDDEDLELEALLRELEEAESEEDVEETEEDETNEGWDSDLDEDFMFEEDEEDEEDTTTEGHDEDLDEDFMFEDDEEDEEEDDTNEGWDSDLDEDFMFEEDEEESHESEEDVEESFDLHEFLREIEGLEEGEDEECHECVKESQKAEIKSLKKELEETKRVVSTLKTAMNEVNLLNAKLLYTNKIFRNYNLTNEQKVKVIDNIDRSANVREAKLIFTTLSESFKMAGTEKRLSESKKSLVEGMASKTVGSTAPAKKIINETSDMARRFQELAGIVK